MAFDACLGTPCLAEIPRGGLTNVSPVWPTWVGRYLSTQTMASTHQLNLAESGLLELKQKASTCRTTPSLQLPPLPLQEGLSKVRTASRGRPLRAVRQVASQPSTIRRKHSESPKQDYGDHAEAGFVGPPPLLPLRIRLAQVLW